MKQKIVITIPPGRLVAVQPQLFGLATLCGGQTSVPGYGDWKDAEGHWITENVTQVSFCVPFSVGYSTVEGATQELVKALFRAGEQAVLVEYYRPGGYTFSIYEREGS